MYCHKCGAEIDDEAIICPHCGCGTIHYQEDKHQAEVTAAQTAARTGSAQGRPADVSRKSRMVALLLAIFLGEIGVHRFYLGKVGTGLLYLFTFGLFGVGWLIDIIMIACGSATDSTGRYVLSWDPSAPVEYDDTYVAEHRPVDPDAAAEEEKIVRTHRTIRIVVIGVVVVLCLIVLAVQLLVQYGIL